MKKILIIDDDYNIRDYLVSLLEDNGYKTVTAGDVREGMKIAKADPPDLITLDLEMPGEWGPRFYRQMAQEPSLRNIPVIVISGLTGNEYAIGKAVATLNKPFDREELLLLIKENIR